jgi:DNA-binding NarL/FixJ family response regulator
VSRHSKCWDDAGADWEPIGPVPPPRKKRVAGHVAAGKTRKEIAAAGGVSDGTIKSQLATIFDKTGTGDQRELELLIRELSPPLRSR